MEIEDEVNFAIGRIRKGNQIRTRRASLVSLPEICTSQHQRRPFRAQGCLAVQLTGRSMVLDSYVTMSLVFEVDSAAQQFNGYCIYIHFQMRNQEGIAALNLYVRDDYVRAAPGGARGVKSITNYSPVNSVRLPYHIGDKRQLALKV
ncbi:unnamed protein product [Arabis nemorensis]|uniref:Wings apart-like protein C-terminal domain-containing protein n=1 Tax=Arabis nemorensis TaxID=586526 RepID=A0A565BAT8_9BRAS|nr:unnamed protein product [Arabis nemorensis]